MLRLPLNFFFVRSAFWCGFKWDRLRCLESIEVCVGKLTQVEGSGWGVLKSLLFCKLHYLGRAIPAYFFLLKDI